MTKILSTIIGFIFFGSIASAQLTEFSQGDILSAGAMNQNFKYLEDRFGGLNEKTVDCGTSGTGSGINAAIKDGYNSIIVKGICKENINWDSSQGERGYLKLKGYSNDQTSDKIVDNSSSSNSVISLTNSYLKIDNLTISGGTRGVHVSGNALLWADNVTVESYTQRGISVTSSSVGWFGSVTVDGTKQSSSDERGMWFVNSDGYIGGTTTIKGNSSSQGGINSSNNSRIWIDGTLNLDSNKRGLKASEGGMIGIGSSAKTTITNSTEFGIHAYLGRIVNYGTITISDSSDGNFGILIDRSDAYLKNLTVTGGSGSDPLVGAYDSRLRFNGVTIKNHQGTLLSVERSTFYVEGTNSITNESSSDGCLVIYKNVNFKMDGSTTMNGTNNSDCNAFNIMHSRGEIKDLTVSSPKDSIYSFSSDVTIYGGSYSSTGESAMRLEEGSRFNIESSDNNISITSNSSSEEALQVRNGSIARIKQASNSLSIDAPNYSPDIIVRGKSQAKVDVDGTIASFEIREMSFLELDSGTLTLLSCGSMSYAEKDGGTISTVNGNCNYGSNSY